MRISPSILALALMTGGLTGCLSSSDPPSAGSGGSAAAGAGGGAAAGAGGGGAVEHCASIAQLKAWQAEIDQFDGGYRPTGSPAHEGYISLLQKELTDLGVSDVHTEPYAFTKWTPSTWSLSIVNGPSAGPVKLSGYVPYSGSTGPIGVTTGMVYLPSFTIPIDPTSLADELKDPSAFGKALGAGLKSVLAAFVLAGKIAVFEVPKIEVALSTVTGKQIFVNDPGHTIPPNGTITRTDLSTMLYIPVMLNALAAAGAVGAVGILDAPEEAAREAYAPFFGVVSPNMPSVYVDRDTGANLKALGPLVAGRLVLDASLAVSSSENLIGLLPGESPEEIVIGSHTDGPNSIEDNGPAAVLALASCLQKEKMPRSVRIVLSGGHFVSSLGLNTYSIAHAADLKARALVSIEIEHLGALEWAEVSPGVMGLTGETELQLLTTWANAPMVDASKDFAAAFPRSIVGTPPLLGEGPNLRAVPLIQFITMPQYLLLGHLPAITSQFTDYALMQRQVDAFARMEKALAVAPAAELGVP